MRKYNLFNFLEKKISTAEMSTIITDKINRIAFKELALHIGISYIANTMSKCEIKTYENGKEVRGKLWYMLNVSPNANENSSQFINKWVNRHYREGEALLVPIGDSIYCADGFSLDDSNPLKEYQYSNITFGNQQLKRKHRASEVFNMKLEDENAKLLIDSLYDQYSEIIGLAFATYKRTNGKKYKLLLEQYRAGDPQFNEVFEKVIKQQLEAFIKNDNAVYPQFKGTDLQEFSTATPTNSSDIIAMRKETFEITAQGLKIPLPMLYGNMTNIKEITAQFLTFCIDPFADMTSEEYTRKYYGYDGWKNGNKIEVDTTCISHIDILDVATAVDKLISSGVMCVDELRNVIGYNALNTDFSRRHFMTKNYEPAENALNRADG